jgi:hypothetical protein
MLARTAARVIRAPTATALRSFSASSARQTKVAVLGAGGGIGQPLSLLLKCDPLVTSLSLYDIRGAPGVAADVGHVDASGDVRVSCMKTSMTEFLTGCIDRLSATLQTSSTRPSRASRSS